MPDGQTDIKVLALFGGVAKLGSERANLEALSAVKEKGAEVRLLVSDAPWAEEIRLEIRRRGFEMRQCPFLLIPRPERRFNPWLVYPWVMTRASVILLRELITFGPTHVHISNQLVALNFLPCLAVSATPIIYRCGDKPILHHWSMRTVWKFLVRRTRRFVAVSRFIASTIQETGVAPDRIEVIYSRPPARMEPSGLNVPRGGNTEFRIVFVGQLNQSKGPHVLIEAFRTVMEEFPRACLLIAGRISDWGGDAWARSLRDTTVRHGNSAGRILFLGFVEDIPALMAKCDLNVIPTLTEEPLANVVFEAKQAGLPSVIFPSGGLPEAIDHGVDGYVCGKKSAEALAEALRYYLSNPLRVAEHGRAARMSLNRFRMAEFADRWARVYSASRPGGSIERPAGKVLSQPSVYPDLPIHRDAETL